MCVICIQRKSKKCAAKISPERFGKGSPRITNCGNLCDDGVDGSGREDACAWIWGGGDLDISKANASTVERFLAICGKEKTNRLRYMYSMRVDRNPENKPTWEPLAVDASCRDHDRARKWTVSALVKSCEQGSAVIDWHCECKSRIYRWRNKGLEGTFSPQNC